MEASAHQPCCWVMDSEMVSTRRSLITGCACSCTLKLSYSNPHVGVFSYWSVRAGSSPGGSNKGLRLDHALVSKSIANGGSKLTVHDCQILHEYAPKGDHCPIMVSLRRG